MEKQLPSSGPAGPYAPVPCTTFVQTDAAAFKELVQRLTGPHDDSLHQAQAQAQAASAPPTLTPSSPPAQSKATGIRKPPFKLHERRQLGPMRSKLTILKPGPPLLSAVLSPNHGPESPSSSCGPSPLVSPSTGLARLGLESPTGSLGLNLNEEAEEKAIKERRFYLHPSPRSGRPWVAEPELLPLFPLTSSKSIEP